MDPGARRRACVAFRGKLSRDTGVTLAAATCESLVGTTFKDQGEGGELVTLQSNPGRFYSGLGAAIMDQQLLLGHPDHEKVAWWCSREAAEVHTHPAGMRLLAGSLFHGQGATEDPAQAAVWFQKAADLGDTVGKAKLGALLVDG